MDGDPAAEVPIDQSAGDQFADDVIRLGCRQPQPERDGIESRQASPLSLLTRQTEQIDPMLEEHRLKPLHLRVVERAVIEAEPLHG